MHRLYHYVDKGKLRKTVTALTGRQGQEAYVFSWLMYMEVTVTSSRFSSRCADLASAIFQYALQYAMSAGYMIMLINSSQGTV